MAVTKKRASNRSKSTAMVVKRRRKRVAEPAMVRRVQAKSKSITINDLLVMGMGALAAGIVLPMITDKLPESFQKFTPYLPLAGGVALFKLGKDPMMKNIAIGMAIAGVAPIGKALKLIKGAEDSPYINQSMFISGYNDNLISAPGADQIMEMAENNGWYNPNTFSKVNAPQSNFMANGGMSY